MKTNSLLYKCTILVTLTALSFTACKKLDTKPLGVATEGDISAGGFDAAAFGLYGKILKSNGVTSWERYWFQSIRSDDAAKGSSPSDQATAGNTFDNFSYNASDDKSKANWDGHYGLIYACNDLIDAIDKSGKSDNGTLINKAEARAIRAFAYFDLRRDYGQVPLISNKIVTATDAQKAKSTVAEVDAFIKADLEFASQYLPVSWSAYPGRATKGFANSLLAKLYLYQNNWSSAFAKCQEVINSGSYSLLSSYKTLFSEAGDNSSEAIFEVQFLRTAQGVNYSTNYWESQGVRGSGVWDLGWGFNVPTPALVSAYEANDPRKDVTVLTSGGTDGFGLTLPGMPPLDQMYWNKKAYTTPSIRQGYGENKNHWINIKILRYADVILMAAEAANELGNTSAALSYLEMIRSRARSGTSALPEITTTNQSTLRTAIKQERRIELALEGERFYDLVRWGDAPAVLGGLGYQPRNALFPIPQTAIDQSGGLLTQNPNY